MKTTSKRNSDYLWFRAGTDLIWFSRAVPKHLWEREGRRAVQFSLGIRDRRNATALARQHAAELDRKWGLVPAEQRVPTDDELQRTAVRWGYDLMLDSFDRQRKSLPPGDAEAWREFVAARHEGADRRARQLHTGDLEAVRQTAEKVAAREGWSIKPGDPQFERFADHLAVASLDAMNVERRKLAGELDALPKSELVSTVRERSSRTAAPGESLLELFDKYAAVRTLEGIKRADTLAQDRKVIEQFSEFVGKDRAVDSITAADVREYRDTLRDLPPKWRDRRDMRGLGMREAAVKARAMGLPQTAPTSINKHLSTISPLYKWLFKQQWKVQNPCDGLFYEKVKGKNPRPPFGTERLNKVLASPLFTGFLADGREHLPGNLQADDWRRWVPLICLFTGMRVGEAAQLRVDDVSLSEGSWAITIQHDVARGQTTKSGHSRLTIAHPVFLKLGFLAFVEGQRTRAAKDRDTRLFPELEPDERAQIGDMPSRFWRDYLQRIGVKGKRDGLGAHSFRHELADRLRVEGGYHDFEIAVALGHEQKSTTGGYGGVRQGTVKSLAPMINSVTFEGVSLDHLQPFGA